MHSLVYQCSPHGHRFHVARQAKFRVGDEFRVRGRLPSARGFASLTVPFGKVRVWTLSIGFTLSFGAIFSKTWRVHTIFTNVNASKRVRALRPKSNRAKESCSFSQAVKDYRLFLFVGALLALDTMLLTTWQIVDPLKMFKKISQKEVGKGTGGELETHETCLRCI